MRDLSIVIPTYNRAALLERSLRSLHRTVGCDFEVIVVDGASTDGTVDVLTRSADLLGGRLKVIAEPTRQGFVRAANRGFRAATGRHMTWLNDDARPLSGALDTAVDAMDAAPADLGFLALFHRWHSPNNVAHEAWHNGRAYQVCHVRGTLYANFCVGRRATFERLGLFDERYYFYAADPDLSLKAWHAGLRVVPLVGAYVEHDEHEDDRRAADADRGRQDNERLFAKWDLPPRNPDRNDFDPARPCTLRGLRAGHEAAA
jgi:GT2 family glycosyltransferase